MGAGRKECWVTTALDTKECVKALVLAKSLKRVLTSRNIVVLVNPSIPEELWELLQNEFDSCIRLDKRWMSLNGMTIELYANLYCWSMVKWSKVAFLNPNTLAVRNADNIFKSERTYSSASEGVFLCKPSDDIWRNLLENFGKIRTSGEFTHEKLLHSAIASDDIAELGSEFSLEVNVEVTKNYLKLNESSIVKFVENHPLDILIQNAASSGDAEQDFVILWKNHFESGVAQALVKQQEINYNGLKVFLDKYKSPLIDQPFWSPTEDLDQFQNAVAIVGIGCRFPGANSLEEFWKLLVGGKDAIVPVPEGRWTLENCPWIPKGSMSSCGGFLNIPLDQFDGKFFGVSAMELSFMDPQQRLLLQIAWEALEDAGIDPTSLKNSYTGVFGGSWRTDYREMIQDADCEENDFLRIYLGNTIAVLTARISHILGLTGPCISTESGCSSSMVAVDLAVKSLQRGETDMSLATGVNLMVRPFTGKTMNTVLAPDAHCKTFDESADGFARAEGCGVLVMKRYADAVKDGDRVYGLIRGSAVVQEGASRSLGTPTKYCEALAMRLALEDAGVHPHEVSYVETHGTGTPVGDPLEVAAVAEVYSKGRIETLTIGSVKTNIGHTEACSGIAGIIKVILSLQNEMIPPHRNFEKLNPLINLEVIPARIPLEPLEWKRDPSGKPRIAGVSSFGITGTDAHAILQEAPRNPPMELSFPKESPTPLQILTISARSEESLTEKIKQYRSFLTESSESLQDIAFTCNVGRAHFPHRTVIVGKDVKELLEKLKSPEKKLAPEEAPKICFLFTGQGSQYPGMAKDLYTHSLVFRTAFDECDSVLNGTYGISIREALWGNNSANLGRTIYSQTSIFVVEFCLLKLWESWGVKPDFVMGHSLGEFAAAVGAGILSFEDALKLVAERSRLIDSLPGGKMLVMKESKESVDSMLKVAFKGSERWLDYAAVNSPEQTVVAGTEENVKHFAEFCKNNQIKTHILDATHAFHSRHMDPILPEYKKVADTVTYNAPKCVFVSGMEGRIIEEDGHVGADYWVRHTRDSVRFASSSKAVLELGVSLFLEVGPQPVLSALTMINSDRVQMDVPLQCLPSIRKQEENWPSILGTLSKLYLSGVNINWKGVYRFANTKKVSVPLYPFHNKAYWFDMPERGAAEIHPLVGTPVSNATSTKLYANKLDVKNSPFLKDHMIGNKIIFPGAGFLEMCLVAGHAATQCSEAAYFSPLAPITLENFVIESPLGLSENEVTQLQSVVTSEDSGETRVVVYSKLVLDKETHKWIRHASGVFTPFAVETKNSDGEKITSSLEEARSRCVEKVTIDGTYGKLAEFGLKFGPTFQTLKGMSKGEKEALFEVAVTDDPTAFICHPVVADAMIQAIMIATNPDSHKLHVPVSINKFVSVAPIPAGEDQMCYIHCVLSGQEIAAYLFDAEGKTLAIMVGATLMETSVAVIMSALEAQRVSLPGVFEDVWRSQTGHMDRRAELIKTFNERVFDEDFQIETNRTSNDVDEQDEYFFQQSKKLYGQYVLKTLRQLHFTPAPATTFDLSEAAASLKVKESLTGLFRYLLDVAGEEGYFELTSGMETQNPTYRSVKELPSMSEIEGAISSLHPEVSNMYPLEVEFVSNACAKIASVVTGKESGLPILFPEDPEVKANADYYYNQSRLTTNVFSLTGRVMPVLLENCASNLEETKGTLRILEVGAGTGSFTKLFLPYLKGSPEGYEYTYTDLSAVFFQMGRQIFEGTKFKVNYKVLNIDVDCCSQNFIPHHYDMIVANNVIHATSDVTVTIRNLRNLLREDGVLLITESLLPIRATTLAFGLLDAYWGCKDVDLRPHHCILNLDTWRQVLGSLDFSDIGSVTSYKGNIGFILARASRSSNYILPAVSPEEALKHTWVIFSDGSSNSEYFKTQLVAQGKNVVEVVLSDDKKFLEKGGLYSVRDDSDEDISSVFASLKESNAVVQGVVYFWGMLATDTNYSRVARPYLNLLKTLLSVPKFQLCVVTKGILSVADNDVTIPTASMLYSMTKAFQNEHQNCWCRCLDMDDSDVSSSETLQEIFSELFIDDGEMFVAYRGKQRKVVKLTAVKFPNTALSFPKTERFHLVLPASHAINDLRFGATEKTPVGDNQVEVRVKAYALNFRDVLTVIKPIEEFLNFNTVGIDYSGVITSVGAKVANYQVGDSVFGFNVHGDAMGSHLVATEKSIFRVPPHMTHSEASTLPAVTATVAQCFLQIAKLTKDDTVLIHTGSGGVGLIAIQVAQHIGATIVTTAGSKRKRAFLRNMGLKHIFHSRNTSFEKDIRKALNGKGVDVVLNSLTSEGFKEASLAACNEGARFIEMSKLNIWTPEEVEALRPDVKYTTVDLSAAKEEDMDSLKPLMFDLMEHSVIKPLPFVRFDAAEVREALMYLQKAKHVGKIVCTMPEPAEGGKLVTRMFNDTSSYLITGGLGGIGFEICKWMIQMGAKTVVLAGRSPPNEKTQEEIDRLNAAGSNVVVLQADVSDYEQCQRLIETIKRDLPALRGIMHAAGVLTDATYENQTWEKYERTLKPKVNGGWNLHTLTQDCRLEHFVMYSSVAASFGALGQSNHAAANYFLDSLAFYRNSIGLPATTVNWGQWGQVGVASNLEVLGFRPFSVLQGVTALEKVMKTQKLQSSVAEIDMTIAKQLFSTAKKYLEELKFHQADSGKECQISNEQFWNEYDAADSDEKRTEVIRAFVRIMIRQILKLDKDEPLNDDQNFQDLGMDSLMMIEMKNIVQSTVGKRVTITVNSVKDCHNVNELTAKLAQLLSGDGKDAVVPTREELIQLIKEDSQLPVNIVPAGQAVQPSEIRTVFFTGVTGNLGPYLLKDIANRPNILKVYCLIRAENAAEGLEKLKRILQEKNLLEKIPMEKVECVAGTVIKPLLGLTPEEYKKLSEEVDGVVHLAVKSNFVDIYRKVEGESDLRTVNVKGTLNVLEFVCSERTKVLFHASSIVANGAVAEDLSMSESWPAPEEFNEQPNSAYPISKFISDRLMAQAVERGLPVKVFRFPAVGGDSQTGANVVFDNNQLMLRQMCYFYFKKTPAVPLPYFILPVDVCSTLSLNVFFNDASPYDIYNVYNPQSCNETELVKVAEEMGYKMEIEEPEKFNAILHGGDEKSPLIQAMLMWTDNKEMSDKLKDNGDGGTAVGQAWMRNPQNAFLSKKLCTFCPETYPSTIEHPLSIMKRDLTHAKELGLFDKFGITSD